jgi:hypothetical protein
MNMMGMGGGSQYLFSLNQFLFGIQSVIFSLGQAVQIVGMNAQQIKGVVSSLRGMVEGALGSVKEYSSGGNRWEEIVEEVMGGMEAKRWILGEEHDNRNVVEDEILTENEIIRRRRLAAFRWTLTLTISYAAYRTVRRLIRTLILGSGDSNRHYNRGYISNDSYNGGRYPNHYGVGYGRRGGYGHGNGHYGGSSMGYGGGYGGGYDPYGGSGYY